MRLLFLFENLVSGTLSPSRTIWALNFGHTKLSGTISLANGFTNLTNVLVLLVNHCPLAVEITVLPQIAPNVRFFLGDGDDGVLPEFRLMKQLRAFILKKTRISGTLSDAPPNLSILDLTGNRYNIGSPGAELPNGVALRISGTVPEGIFNSKTVLLSDMRQRWSFCYTY